MTATALTALAAPAAHAALPAAKGDNGTVKIHEAGTGQELVKNEPKVCDFYLAAFTFDEGQKANWEIQAWAGNDLEKGTVVESGSLTLDEEGHGRTEDMRLADGQYKLFWTFEGEKGKAKHKVFKSACEPGETGPTPGETKPTPGETGPTPGETKPTPGETEPTPGETKPTPGETEPTPGETKPAPGGTGPAPESSESAAPVPGDDTSGNLAETGSGTPVGALAAGAALLVGAGGYLLARRRTATRS
ncbi:LPXTG cell wall anchor domain-containing protein [Streptomyces sp. C10-9-1]|uniref:LPXTG cell wall anchor domain-containing protein n=1 Tax=Streptomyces sp. C10-9-1 TaxID=1859285 RepID=UPI0021124313|nr:LPXTG cell wall anchor domain-containing protein [Streptomyces sp. C10-9-1]MCQ6555636.1 LPXTG cell wall anchor domain-containing protein [Streptomyces sp. C10-9-1]